MKAPVEYVINAVDSIIVVNDAWREFARENDAPELAERVLGQSLWLFIAEPSTRMLHQTLVHNVRTKQTSIKIAFRCDAPALRRFMELRLTAEEDQCVRFAAALLRSEPRPAVPLLDAAAPRSDELLTMCAWCKRIKLDEDTWREVEEALARMAILQRFPLPGITHAICPECLVTCMRSLETLHV